MSDGLRIIGIVRAYEIHPELAARLGGRPCVGVLRDQALREGTLRLVLEQHNMVVDQGIEAIACFLGNNANAPTVGGSTFGTMSDITVGTMELGTAVNPPAPMATDTAGVGSLVYQPPLTVSYPTPASIMFSGVLPIGEANGLVITEEALRLVNGKVIAKATFYRPKTSSNAMQFDHRILFARA